MNKAVFLDKDGTVIKNVHYNADPDKVQLNNYAAEALHRLQQSGYRLIIVSNQAGVAHGYFTEAELARVNRQLVHLLALQHVKLDALLYCPHHIDGVVKEYSLQCDCRKPAAGMLLQAARDLDISLADSWMVGDIADDIEAGHRAGCTAILLHQETTGVDTAPPHKDRLPDYTAHDLNEVADIILSPIANGHAQRLEKL